MFSVSLSTSILPPVVKSYLKLTSCNINLDCLRTSKRPSRSAPWWLVPLMSPNLVKLGSGWESRRSAPSPPCGCLGKGHGRPRAEAPDAAAAKSRSLGRGLACGADCKQSKWPGQSGLLGDGRPRVVLEEMLFLSSHKGRSRCHYFSAKRCTTSPGSVEEPFFGLWPLQTGLGSSLLIRVAQTGGEGGAKGRPRSLASTDFLFPPTPSNLEGAREIPAVSGPARKVC